MPNPETTPANSSAGLEKRHVQQYLVIIQIILYSSYESWYVLFAVYAGHYNYQGESKENDDCGGVMHCHAGDLTLINNIPR